MAQNTHPHGSFFRMGRQVKVLVISHELAVLALIYLNYSYFMFHFYNKFSTMLFFWEICVANCKLMVLNKLYLIKLGSHF